MAHWLTVSLLPLGCVLAAATVWQASDSFVDDAFISLRYAHNLLEGQGLVFNSGEYVEGFTNLGQVLLVSGLGALGLDLVAAARLLGIAGGILAVIFGPAALLPRSEGRKLERSIARLLLLSNFSFVYFASTGMETTLYVGLICLTCFVFDRQRNRIGWTVGWLSGALFVIRPDGALYGLALVCLGLSTHGIRRVLKMPGPWVWAATGLAVEAWRFAYYHALVPNTALIKGGGGPATPDGLPWYGMIGDDVVELLSQTGGPIALCFAAVALIRHENRDRIRLAAVIGIAAGLFAIYSGGDWMPGYRFLLPALPFYLTLVAIGLVHVAEALRRTTSGEAIYTAFLAAIAVTAFTCWSFGLEFHFHSDRYPNTHMTSRYMIPAAKWIGARYPHHYQLTAGAIGSLGYHSRLVIIDRVGLIDAKIPSFHGDPDRIRVYIAERNPELVLTSVPGDEERLLFGRHYKFERSFVIGAEGRWLLYRRSDLPEPREPDTADGAASA
jgi:hypothetical protein